MARSVFVVAVIVGNVVVFAFLGVGEHAFFFLLLTKHSKKLFELRWLADSLLSV